MNEEKKPSVIELSDIPERVDFNCHDCERPCIMYPRSKPIAVMHSVPVCESWQDVEGKKDDLERYLIKCGVHMIVPGSRSAVVQ